MGQWEPIRPKLLVEWALSEKNEAHRAHYEALL